MLFMERMLPNEAIVIIGAERYSYYMGYGDSLKFSAPFFDSTERDNLGRRLTQIVAIDAVPYGRNTTRQFRPEHILRDLNKAYVGFHEPSVNGNRPTAVATGNWGCGAFGGSKQLKSLIQLLAACQCQRDLAYFTFDDHQLTDDLFLVYSALTKNDVTVGKLLASLHLYFDLEIDANGDQSNFTESNRTLFEFLSDLCD